MAFLKPTLFGAGRFLQLLRILSFASGCAALIYEVVWFQLLQLVIGSSAVSLGVLLGTYMGGMCLGNLLLPRIVSPGWNPLRVGAVLEAGIGGCGLLILLGLPEAEILYRGAGAGNAGVLVRALFAAGCLLLPTLLMGATLPILGRCVRMSRAGVSQLGSLYGCNIAGAVTGCLVAGFYLLRFHDTIFATAVAAAVNGSIAAIAWYASFSRGAAPARARMRRTPAKAGETRPSQLLLPVYFAIALSGAAALGAEVVWTRLLSLMLGGTVYTFSIILAVFLIGLGVGSHFGSRLARRVESPALMLGGCQLLLMGAIAWTAYMLMNSLPFWPNAGLDPGTWVNFQISLSRCLWALLPATLLWGASFPLALAAASTRCTDPARLFGNIAAANTLGGILGGVGFSVILIPLQGMQYGQRLLIGLSGCAAILALVSTLWNRSRQVSPAMLWRAGLASVGVVVAAVALAGSVSRVPGELLAFGHNAQWLGRSSQLLYAGEGQNYPVGVSQIWNSDIRVFHVSGKIEASTYVQDMRLQRMLGTLPALLHPKPESVLVVGCGAGVTAGSFTLDPDVKKIVICELEPLVPKIAAKYFSTENNGVINDYRTEMVYDDARHYVLTTTNRFDIITSDPIHPWVKGSASLYTREYFEMVKAHLNPGGIVTQWVPLYESDTNVVKSELATFFSVFPNGTIWSSDLPGRGSDIVLLGQYSDAPMDLDKVQRRLADAGYARIAQSLREVGYHSALDLFASYSGQACDLAPWLQGAQVNHDRDLRLEYLAGLTMQKQIGNPIYKEMLAYRKFPTELFVGSRQMREALSARWPGLVLN